MVPAKIKQNKTQRYKPMEQNEGPKPDLCFLR
jgi:hypothetical protein